MSKQYNDAGVKKPTALCDAPGEETMIGGSSDIERNALEFKGVLADKASAKMGTCEGRERGNDDNEVAPADADRVAAPAVKGVLADKASAKMGTCEGREHGEDVNKVAPAEAERVAAPAVNEHEGLPDDRGDVKGVLADKASAKMGTCEGREHGEDVNEEAPAEADRVAAPAVNDHEGLPEDRGHVKGVLAVKASAKMGTCEGREHGEDVNEVAPAEADRVAAPAVNDHEGLPGDRGDVKGVLADKASAKIGTCEVREHGKDVNEAAPAEAERVAAPAVNEHESLPDDRGDVKDPLGDEADAELEIREGSPEGEPKADNEEVVPADSLETPPMSEQSNPTNDHADAQKHEGRAMKFRGQQGLLHVIFEASKMRRSLYFSVPLAQPMSRCILDFWMDQCDQKETDIFILNINRTSHCFCFAKSVAEKERISRQFSGGFHFDKEKTYRGEFYEFHNIEELFEALRMQNLPFVKSILKHDKQVYNCGSKESTTIECKSDAVYLNDSEETNLLENGKLSVDMVTEIMAARKLSKFLCWNDVVYRVPSISKVLCDELRSNGMKLTDPNRFCDLMMDNAMVELLSWKGSRSPYVSYIYPLEEHLTKDVRCQFWNLPYMQQEGLVSFDAKDDCMDESGNRERFGRPMQIPEKPLPEKNSSNTPGVTYYSSIHEESNHMLSGGGCSKINEILSRNVKQHELYEHSYWDIHSWNPQVDHRYTVCDKKVLLNRFPHVGTIFEISRNVNGRRFGVSAGTAQSDEECFGYTAAHCCLLEESCQEKVIVQRYFFLGYNGDVSRSVKTSSEAKQLIDKLASDDVTFNAEKSKKCFEDLFKMIDEKSFFKIHGVKACVTYKRGDTSTDFAIFDFKGNAEYKLPQHVTNCSWKFEKANTKNTCDSSRLVSPGSKVCIPGKHEEFYITRTDETYVDCVAVEHTKEFQISELEDPELKVDSMVDFKESCNEVYVISEVVDVRSVYERYLVCHASDVRFARLADLQLGNIEENKRKCYLKRDRTQVYTYITQSGDLVLYCYPQNVFEVPKAFVAEQKVKEWGLASDSDSKYIVTKIDNDEVHILRLQDLCVESRANIENATIRPGSRIKLRNERKKGMIAMIVTSEFVLYTSKESSVVHKTLLDKPTTHEGSLVRVNTEGRRRWIVTSLKNDMATIIQESKIDFCLLRKAKWQGKDMQANRAEQPARFQEIQVKENRTWMYNRCVLFVDDKKIEFFKHEDVLRVPKAKLELKRYAGETVTLPKQPAEMKYVIVDIFEELGEQWATVAPDDKILKKQWRCEITLSTEQEIKHNTYCRYRRIELGETFVSDFLGGLGEQYRKHINKFQSIKVDCHLGGLVSTDSARKQLQAVGLNGEIHDKNINKILENQESDLDGFVEPFALGDYYRYFLRESSRPSDWGNDFNWEGIQIDNKLSTIDAKAKLGKLNEHLPNGTESLDIDAILKVHESTVTGYCRPINLARYVPGHEFVDKNDENNQCFVLDNKLIPTDSLLQLTNRGIGEDEAKAILKQKMNRKVLEIGGYGYYPNFAAPNTRYVERMDFLPKNHEYTHDFFTRYECEFVSASTTTEAWFDEDAYASICSRNFTMQGHSGSFVYLMDDFDMFPNVVSALERTVVGILVNGVHDPSEVYLDNTDAKYPRVCLSGCAAVNNKFKTDMEEMKENLVELRHARFSEPTIVYY